MENQILHQKIAKEQTVLSGAQKLLRFTRDDYQKQLCELQISQTIARITYLQSLIASSNSPITKDSSYIQTPTSIPTTPVKNPKKLVLNSKTSMLNTLIEKLGLTAKKQHVSTVKTNSESTLVDLEQEYIPSGFEFLKNETFITTELLIYRLNNIRCKLEFEKRLKAGTENMLSSKGSNRDLLQKLDDSQAKITLLSKSEFQYNDLLLQTFPEQDFNVTEESDRCSSNITIKLIEAFGISNRKSLNDDILAKIKVDGTIFHISKSCKIRWDETFNLTLNRALEMEIIICEKSTGDILAILPVKVLDFIDYLKANDGFNQITLDLEPSGQITLQAKITPPDRKNEISRQKLVTKIFPRNGHKFMCNQSYQVKKCAICHEFMKKADYSCISCQYSVHAGCSNSIFANCLNAKEEAIEPSIIKYNIPHKWDAFTNIMASWCEHCGQLMTPGRRAYSCIECGLGFHKSCTKMVSSHCGLSTELASIYILRLEEIERKMYARELQEAELTRKSKEVIGLSNETFPYNIWPREKFHQHPTLKRAADLTLASAPIFDPQTIKITDFNIHAVVGRGTFGKVMLVSENYTGNYYAIKAIKKSQVIRRGEINSILTEKIVLGLSSESRHPFLVNLHSSFQTKEHLFFVMEYASGGDLMSQIREVRRFSPIRAKFYACEILLAIEYLHSQNVIYRDLKLENILVDFDGHIKVADYGICKTNIGFGDLTSTFCGTENYMAIEILDGRKYGLSCDWWSFGIIIFVMLTGTYPYAGNDFDEIRRSIKTTPIQFPFDMDDATVSVISELLDKNPTRRLGGGSIGAEEIRRHLYFSGVDWKGFLHKIIKPPFVPKIKNAEDVSNFDSEFTVEMPLLTVGEMGLISEEEDLSFDGFEYSSPWAIDVRSNSLYPGRTFTT